ncbi:hypothetical protein Tco_1311565 [Tanacetum coccineum]
MNLCPASSFQGQPPHLEYAFLEGDNKLPVIIAKDLSIREKTALIKVLQVPQAELSLGTPPISRLFSNTPSTQISGKDNIYLPIRTFAIPSNALWPLQCTCHIPEMYEAIVHDISKKRWKVGYWMDAFGFWKFFLYMPNLFGKDAKAV